MPVKTPSKLAEVAKNPAAYVLILAAGLLGAVMRGDSRDDRRTDDCKTELATCRIDLRAKDSAYTALTRELLIKQGVIDALPHVTDSVIKRIR